MKIKDIYQKYNIHPNLVSHMVRVAKVSDKIVENWNGPKVESKTIILLSLLHDLGNIVRMNVNEENWIQIKKATIEKYGDEDDLVTKKILDEVGVDAKISKAILDKRFANAIKIKESDDWSLKILLYSDLRVAPEFITTLKDRLDEVIPRRPDLKNHPQIKELIASCFEIENQIQKHCIIKLSDIRSDSVEKDDSKYLNFPIK